MVMVSQMERRPSAFTVIMKYFPKKISEINYLFAGAFKIFKIVFNTRLYLPF